MSFISETMIAWRLCSSDRVENMNIKFAAPRGFIGMTALIAILHTTTALADNLDQNTAGRLPAVSGVNGKLDFSYLYTDTNTSIGDAHGGMAIGSISTPIGSRIGLQIDAGIGRFNASTAVGDIDSYGVGGHLFTRDPEVGLLGVYGHYLRTDFGPIDLNSYRYGVEAEWYVDQFSLEAFAGADHVDAGAIDKTFASLDFTAAYYVTENVRLDAGVLRQFDSTLGKVGFEAALPMFNSNASLYANASFGGGEKSVRAGLRIYFGGDDKSLIDRHRQDDPKERLINFVGLNLADFVLAAAPTPVMSCGEESMYRCNRVPTTMTTNTTNDF